MTPAEYVAWTDTTACAAASTLNYLNEGVAEETEEVDAVVSEIEMWGAKMRAATHGYRKRLLRGDSDETLRAKLTQGDEAMQQIARARGRLVEEVGDLLWYCARLARIGEGYRWNRRDRLYGVVEACKVLHIPADRLIEIAIDANVAKLTRRQAEGTIRGEGER